MGESFISIYLQYLRKWWWEMIIGPAVVAIGLYQKVINVELPASTWVLIGVSTFIVGQVLAFRSLWRKTKTMASQKGFLYSVQLEVPFQAQHYTLL